MEIMQAGVPASRIIQTFPTAGKPIQAILTGLFHPP
jgi:hypothetical protein